MIFETERLIIRLLKFDDSDGYFDMMSNVNVMSLIPRNVMTQQESYTHLKGIINKYPERLIWAIEEKVSTNFIGICALLKNSDKENELGYRLREKYWRQGYGSETTKGLINYSFNELKFDKITADVNTANLKSIKILDKFMNPIKEFYNEEDNCTDRRYELKR